MATNQLVLLTIFLQ